MRFPALEAPASLPSLFRLFCLGIYLRHQVSQFHLLPPLKCLLLIVCFSFPCPGLAPTARRVGRILHWWHPDSLLFQDMEVVHVARVFPELRVLQRLLTVWPTGLLEHPAAMDSLQNGGC